MQLSKLSIILSLIITFSSASFAQTSGSQSEGLEFNKNAAVIVCPVIEKEDLKNGVSVVEVTTNVRTQSQNLKYRYSVSGGQIVGNGARVDWDLNKMPSGLYKIRIDIRGKNLRKSFTKEIRLVEPSACDPPCVCPSLSIETPAQTVEEGRAVILTAQTRGGSQTLVKYKWTLSEGEIIKGQGTPKIKISTKGQAGKTITATVEIDGDLCAACPRTAAATVEISLKNQ